MVITIHDINTDEKSLQDFQENIGKGNYLVAKSKQLVGYQEAIDLILEITPILLPYLLNYIKNNKVKKVSIDGEVYEYETLEELEAIIKRLDQSK